jgi:hypothetical protein
MKVGKLTEEELRQVKIVHLFLHQQREAYLRSVEQEVSLNVRLPDGQIAELQIKAFDRTPQVYKVRGQCLADLKIARCLADAFLSRGILQALVEKIGISAEAAKCFGLFSLPLSSPPECKNCLSFSSV